MQIYKNYGNENKRKKAYNQRHMKAQQYTKENKPTYLQCQFDIK